MTEPPKAPPPATREEANAFLKDIEREEDEAGTRARVLRYGKDALDRIVRRLYTDALKSPSQKRGNLPPKRITEADSTEGTFPSDDSPANRNSSPGGTAGGPSKSTTQSSVPDPISPESTGQDDSSRPPVDRPR